MNGRGRDTAGGVGYRPVYKETMKDPCAQENVSKKLRVNAGDMGDRNDNAVIIGGKEQSKSIALVACSSDCLSHPLSSSLAYA